jgi:uncharacterized protein (DUF58 family)
MPEPGLPKQRAGFATQGAFSSPPYGYTGCMSALTTVASAFILGLLVATLMWGGAGLVIGLPVALIVLGAVFALDVKRRRESVTSMEAQRERARTNKVDFTERDKQTLHSE